jgi:hypothetical protein
MHSSERKDNLRTINVTSEKDRRRASPGRRQQAQRVWRNYRSVGLNHVDYAPGLVRNVV